MDIRSFSPQIFYQSVVWTTADLLMTWFLQERHYNKPNILYRQSTWTWRRWRVFVLARCCSPSVKPCWPCLRKCRSVASFCRLHPPPRYPCACPPVSVTQVGVLWRRLDNRFTQTTSVDSSVFSRVFTSILSFFISLHLWTGENSNHLDNVLWISWHHLSGTHCGPL